MAKGENKNDEDVESIMQIDHQFKKDEGSEEMVVQILSEMNQTINDSSALFEDQIMQTDQKQPSTYKLNKTLLQKTQELRQKLLYGFSKNVIEQITAVLHTILAAQKVCWREHALVQEACWTLSDMVGLYEFS